MWAIVQLQFLGDLSESIQEEEDSTERGGMRRGIVKERKGVTLRKEGAMRRRIRVGKFVIQCGLKEVA